MLAKICLTQSSKRNTPLQSITRKDRSKTQPFFNTAPPVEKNMLFFTSFSQGPIIVVSVSRRAETGERGNPTEANPLAQTSAQSDPGSTSQVYTLVKKTPNPHFD